MNKQILNVALAVALSGSALSANAVSYTFTHLGTLGGTGSYASAINEAGQVVGSSMTYIRTRDATVWNGTTATKLGTLGGSRDSANAINEAGQVVGSSMTANYVTHATIWNGTTATDLGTLGVLIATPLPSILLDKWQGGPLPLTTVPLAPPCGMAPLPPISARWRVLIAVLPMP